MLFRLSESSDNKNMKEIKGLDERLISLQQRLAAAQQFVQDQADMAQVNKGDRVIDQINTFVLCFANLSIFALRWKVDTCPLIDMVGECKFQDTIYHVVGLLLRQDVCNILCLPCLQLVTFFSVIPGL